MIVISYGEPSMFGNISEKYQLGRRRKCDDCHDCDDCDCDYTDYIDPDCDCPAEWCPEVDCPEFEECDPWCVGD
jgi:hypothetical protein